MRDEPLCPCGAPGEARLNGLPVCRRCYDEAFTVTGSIMPAPGGVVVRRGVDVWTQQYPMRRPREPSRP